MHPLPLPEEHRPAGELPGILGEAAVHIGHGYPFPLGVLRGFPLGGGGACPLEEVLRLRPGGKAFEHHAFHPVDLGLAGLPAVVDAVAVFAVFHRVELFRHAPLPFLLSCFFDKLHHFPPRLADSFRIAFYGCCSVKVYHFTRQAVYPRLVTLLGGAAGAQLVACHVL